MREDIVPESNLISGETEEDTGPSLRDTLSAAYDEVQEGEATTPEPEIGVKSDRDESGRFKPKDIPSSTPEKTPATPREQVTEPAKVTAPVLPPSGWDAETKELFNQVSPEIQRQLVKRENDLRRRSDQEVEQARQIQRTYAEIDQALAPRMPELQRLGVKPGEVVSRFMAWQQHLDTNPKQGLRDLAQSYGLDLHQLAQEEAQQPQEPAYVRELRNQYQQTQGLLQQFQQQTEAQKVQALQNELLGFTQETDAQGNLVRPHLEHIVEDMLPYVQHIRATNPNMAPRQILQSAYEKAIWANPSTRELELKRSQVVSDPVKTVARAAQAAKLVNGEARGPQIPDSSNSIRDALSASWDRVHGKI